MKLSISSPITIASGLTVATSIAFINANTESLLSDGSVLCNLVFYANQNAKDKSLGAIVPITLKQDGTIDKFIISCKVTLTQQEAAAANLPTTIYNKVAAKLNTDYGWTVTVA